MMKKWYRPMYDICIDNDLLEYDKIELKQRNTDIPCTIFWLVTLVSLSVSGLLQLLSIYVFVFFAEMCILLPQTGHVNENRGKTDKAQILWSYPFCLDPMLGQCACGHLLEPILFRS